MGSPSSPHLGRLARRSALWVLGAALLLPKAAVAQTSNILVHKDPKCGCCGSWVQHLKAAGFAVSVEETASLQVVRKRLRVPADLAACHTAEVDGYVLEGHVPAIAVRRLLENRPVGIGLAVPGMPAGSPGMEGSEPQPYDVVLFGASGRQTFMRALGAKEVG